MGPTWCKTATSCGKIKTEKGSKRIGKNKKNKKRIRKDKNGPGRIKRIKRIRKDEKDQERINYIEKATDIDLRKIRKIGST